MSKAKLILSSLLIALPLVSASVLTGCASVTSQPTVGKRQCPSSCSDKITQSILSRLQSDRGLSRLPIEVSTCHRVVSLTGTVETKAQKRMVIDIARHTPGVRLVKTGLVVRNPMSNY